MRKVIVAGLAAALLSGGAGVAQGANNSVTNPDNLADHPALYGLCTAWAHNDNGRANGNAENAGPFAALQAAAEGENQTVEEFCAGVRPSNGQGGGSGNSKAPAR